MCVYKKIYTNPKQPTKSCSNTTHKNHQLIEVQWDKLVNMFTWRYLRTFFKKVVGIIYLNIFYDWLHLARPMALKLGTWNLASAYNRFVLNLHWKVTKRGKFPLNDYLKLQLESSNFSMDLTYQYEIFWKKKQKVCNWRPDQTAKVPYFKFGCVENKYTQRIN